jgi:K+-sensing histidine kinase KdpD
MRPTDERAEPEHVEVPTDVGVRRTLARGSPEKQRIRSGILRYGFAVLSVAIGVGLALELRYYQFREVEVPVLALSIALTTWYAGTGPSALAIVLSSACFDYFFTEPFYTFYITSRDLPYFFVFIAWAIVVSSFSAVRRRIEDSLRQARDHLQVELEERMRREDEIRKLNHELANQAAELEASNKELESFAYSVSHDLRAPLRHVIGFSELLQRQASPLFDDKSRRYLQTILESAKRMGNLIDDLLGFSRIGRVETRKTAVNLEQLVRDVVAELGQETSGRDITWRIGALPMCYGDRSMLKVVLVNLVSNAVKFTRMRTRAEIEIGSAVKKQNQVEVFVRDNGAGFDMQYANKLFGVFQRLHRSEEFEGTGIGLATAQRIIHRHGGRIWAEGAVDRGATFCFSVPDPESIDNSQQVKAPRGHTRESGNPGGGKVVAAAPGPPLSRG